MKKILVDNQEWLNQKFMARPNAEFLLEGRIIPQTAVDCPFVVSKVDGNRLWAGVAWITKEEVVSVADAVPFFTEYIRKHPQEAWGYLSRGLAWNTLDNTENAITDFTKALHLDPNYEIACYDRGICWMDRGDLAKAIRDFNRAIDLDPEYVRAWYNRGVALYQMGDVDQALMKFTEVIRLEPKHAEAFNDRGVIWNIKGEADKAIDDFSNAVWLAPDYVYAFSNRGAVWYETGEYSHAINDYAEAIRLDPEDRVACNEFAWILATCPDIQYRDGERARVLAEELCESAAWKDASYIDTLAAAYAEVCDFPKAVKFQEMSINLLESQDDKKDFLERLALYREGKSYHSKKAKLSKMIE